MPLSAKSGAAEWIHHFVHSENPRFKGKSKEERIQMALGAYYGAGGGDSKDAIDWAGVLRTLRIIDKEFSSSSRRTKKSAATKDGSPCPDCEGDGLDDDDNLCPTCGGDGYVGLPVSLEDRRKNGDNGDDDNDNGDGDDDDDDQFGDARTVHITDSFLMDNVRKRKDGYLAANARIARAGIQLYNGHEVGMPSMDVVRVYRPPSEVFSKAAMRSMTGLPITFEHPPTMVDSTNWEQHAIGHTGEEVARDGEYLRVPMMMMDAKAIEAYENHGVKELSVGYSTDLKWGQGKTPDGEIYDAKQTAIRGNHLAVVPAARGGSRLRIGDDHQRGGPDMVKVLIDGQSIEFTDELAAKHVQAHLKALQAEIADQKKKAKEGSAAEEEQESEKEERAEKDALIKASAVKDGEIVALKKQLEDGKASFGKQVADRIELLMKANAAMDGKANFDFGTEPAVIHRAVVAAKYGEDFAKSLDGDQIAGAFKAATADVKVQTGVDRLADSLSNLQHGGGGSGNDPMKVKAAAYDAYVNNLGNAWKQPSAKQ